MKADELLTLLKEQNLVVSSGDVASMSFDSLEYDSRQMTANGLFICKGKTFKPEYLDAAIKNGATAYLAEKEYDVAVPGIIVSDIRKAMSLAAQLFFDFPQNHLFIVGITGTKGKTTTTYLTRNILAHAFPGKAAMFSTIDRIVGPKPTDQFKAHLTTAESLDLFKEMRETVDNGMKYLVMEVASQAYLLNRVYGLKFNVGIFLDITPDHIGVNEHTSYANYLFCKQQLMLNSDFNVICSDTNNFEDVLSAAKVSSAPDHIITYGTDREKSDYTIVSKEMTLTDSVFSILPGHENPIVGVLADDYAVSLPGDFNEANSTAAIIAATLAGAASEDIHYGLANTTVPGRMQFITSKNHGTIYIDYAHDWGSMNALMNFLSSQFTDKRIIAVLGSTGDKGEDRREGFAQALNDYADIAFLTADDPGHEDPEDIAKEIDSHIDYNKVQTHIVIDREESIAAAIKIATNNDLVVIAGKGEDKYQKINGVDTPYPSDPVVAQQVLDTLPDEK